MPQASIKQTILFVCVFVTTVVATENRGPPEPGDAALFSDLIDSPPVIFIGRGRKDLVRCSFDNVCENFHQASNIINCLLTSGEYVYAGLNSGEILRCHVNIKNSCNTFYKGSSSVWSLASVRGYLLVGHMNHIILRCETHPPSCKTLHKFDYPVYALIQSNNSIYAGLSSGLLMRCSLTISNKCSQVYLAKTTITGLATLGMSVYISTNQLHLSKCSDAITDCVESKLEIGSSWAIATFNGSLYVQDYQMGIYNWVNNTRYESIINITQSWSVSMAYGSNNLRNQYKNEHVSCGESAQQCQLVTYYNEHERAVFEVYVKEGKLYNTTDSLVDTSDADQGRSGPAAIFIMAPDGKLYLSNHHQGPILTSSFLAGNPVSGAGEIVVEKGVVRRIVACSEHYEPTLKLNAQVIQSLLTQGYMNPIVSETCPEVEDSEQNHQVASILDVKQGPAGSNISETCPENSVHITSSDIEDLDKKLQIIYTMQKSLDDLIKIYATEAHALKEKIDTRINRKQGACRCSDIANGQ